MALREITWGLLYPDCAADCALKDEIPCEHEDPEWPGPEYGGVQLRQCPRAFIRDVDIGRLYSLWRHWKVGSLTDALGGARPSPLLLDTIIWVDDAMQAWEAERLSGVVHG